MTLSDERLAEIRRRASENGAAARRTIDAAHRSHEEAAKIGGGFHAALRTINAMADDAADLLAEVDRLRRLLGRLEMVDAAAVEERLFWSQTWRQKAERERDEAVEALRAVSR